MENRGIGRTVGIVVLTVLITLALAAGGIAAYLKTSDRVVVDRSSYEEAEKQKEEMSKFNTIQDKIDDHFLFEYDKEEEMDSIYKAMVDSLGDPYSRYMDEEAVKELQDTLNNSFSGIGVVFEINAEEEFVVVSVIPDSPAQKAGVLAGDIIKTVNGESYEYIDEIANEIRGEPGTSVTIEFQRGKETLEKKIVRGQITDASITSTTLEDNIGYIQILSFGEETYDKFNAAITEYENNGVKGVVIDLRNNPGGLVNQAAMMADRILPECVITYTEDKNGNRRSLESDGATTALPIVVLINGHSASAAELLAAAIKDNGGGTLIGTTTFGKGIVQETSFFQDGTGLSITTDQYFSPKGSVIHEKGVEPDIVVEAEAAGNDVQLKAALDLLAN